MTANRYPAFSIASLKKHPVVVGVAASPGDLDALRAGPAPCDLVELRLDLLADLDTPERVAASMPCPLLVTLRDAREGGAWQGAEKERLAVYRAWAPVAAWLDIELQAEASAWREYRNLADRHGLHLIGSHHNFEACPSRSEVQALVVKGRDRGADVVKVAALTRTDEDVDALERAVRLNAAGLPLALLGMGERGPMSRVHLPLHGSCFTYGSIGAPTAPGQPRAAELVHALLDLHAGYAAWRRG